MDKFIQKYIDNVTGTISGFNRLVFRENLLRLAYSEGMRGGFRAIGVLLKDFADMFRIL